MHVTDKRRNTVLERIRTACALHHREPASVTLLAASKAHPPERLRQLFNAGQKCFGENYLQEARQKQQALAELDLEWHFIGPIQSNKTRDIAAHFHWVQTLEREKIARRLNEQRPEGLAALNVLLQVNIDREPQKAGLLPEQVADLANEVRGMKNLRLRGLMAIPRATTDAVQAAASMAAMQQLYDQLASRHAQVDTLSLGMSADLELAIGHGSTMIRVGTDLMGPRP